MAAVISILRAVEHVEQIGDFIEKAPPFQARRVLQLIIKETRKLEHHTRIDKMIPEARNDKYRELRVFSYRILYRIIDENTVAIIGVIHGRRLFDPDWLK